MGFSNGIMEGSMAQYRYIMVTGDFYSRIQAKAEVIGKTYIVERIVTASTSSDMAQISATTDSTQVFDIGGSTYHTSLGISFDRPVITSGKKTVAVSEVSVMVLTRDGQRLPNC